jgi:nitroreductase
MTVYKTILRRRSIRRYKDMPVEDEKLSRVLEAARLAPSAINRQNWKFVVVRDAALRARLTEEAIGQPFVGQAPVILVACGTEPDSMMACGQPRYTVDLSIAMSFMVLQACELGLGTCWLGHFYEKQVKQILNIPDHVRVVAMTPLGVPAENPRPRSRKAVEEIVCYDQYQS